MVVIVRMLTIFIFIYSQIWHPLTIYTAHAKQGEILCFCVQRMIEMNVYNEDAEDDKGQVHSEENRSVRFRRDVPGILGGWHRGVGKKHSKKDLIM